MSSQGAALIQIVIKGMQIGFVEFSILENKVNLHPLNQLFFLRTYF